MLCILFIDKWYEFSYRSCIQIWSSSKQTCSVVLWGPDQKNQDQTKTGLKIDIDKRYWSQEITGIGRGVKAIYVSQNLFCLYFAYTLYNNGTFF